MMLYVFWASLCLGLMKISMEAPRQAQHVSRQSPQVARLECQNNAAGIQ